MFSGVENIEPAERSEAKKIRISHGIIENRGYDSILNQM